MICDDPPSVIIFITDAGVEVHCLQDLAADAAFAGGLQVSMPQELLYLPLHQGLGLRPLDPCFLRSLYPLEAKLWLESSGQETLLNHKGASKPPVHGSEEGVDQGLKEPEVAAERYADLLLLGHYDGRDQAAQVALFLTLDLVQCVANRCYDLKTEIDK